MDFHAVARLAQACAWLQDVLGLEATGIRRPGLARSCYFETELFGKHLSYSVHLDGGWAYLRVEGYDQTDGAPSTLLMVADGTEGLKVLCRLVRDLERSGVREIKLPMEIGEPGQVDNWLIVNLSLRRLASRAALAFSKLRSTASRFAALLALPPRAETSACETCGGRNTPGAMNPSPCGRHNLASMARGTRSWQA
jgi:hypothetical protein